MFFLCFRALSTQQGGYVRATNLYYYYYNYERDAFLDILPMVYHPVYLSWFLQRDAFIDILPMVYKFYQESIKSEKQY